MITTYRNLYNGTQEDIEQYTIVSACPDQAYIQVADRSSLNDSFVVGITLEKISARSWGKVTIGGKTNVLKDISEVWNSGDVLTLSSVNGEATKVFDHVPNTPDVGIGYATQGFIGETTGEVLFKIRELCVHA